ncbi:hypothetical protein LTR56_002434 [Elasticomyces elasticus]|nr:hypothetical protein LTR56_002434 [Elasticomyces elasticus]KAK5753734.1 hypothetical protein LTS12_016149 [Elasticomyces elasticus]
MIMLKQPLFDTYIQHKGAHHTDEEYAAWDGVLKTLYMRFHQRLVDESLGDYRGTADIPSDLFNSPRRDNWNNLVGRWASVEDTRTYAAVAGVPPLRMSLLDSQAIHQYGHLGHQVLNARKCQIPPSRGFTKLQSDIAKTFLSLSVRQNPPPGMAPEEWKWRAREAASHAKNADGMLSPVGNWFSLTDRLLDLMPLKLLIKVWSWLAVPSKAPVSIPRLPNLPRGFPLSLLMLYRPDTSEIITIRVSEASEYSWSWQENRTFQGEDREDRASLPTALVSILRLPGLHRGPAVSFVVLCRPDIAENFTAQQCGRGESTSQNHTRNRHDTTPAAVDDHELVTRVTRQAEATTMSRTLVLPGKDTQMGSFHFFTTPELWDATLPYIELAGRKALAACSPAMYRTVNTLPGRTHRSAPPELA